MLSSCSSDDDGGDLKASGHVVALRAQGSSAESADYFLTHDDLSSGEISAIGRGIEQLGWCYYATAGDTYFSVSYDGNECTGYSIVDGAFVEKGKFIFERMDCMNAADENTLVAVGAPWGGGSLNCSIQLIDAEDVSISKQVLTPLYTMSEADTLNKWPTSVVVRGNNLFVSFYPLVGSTWDTPITDTAYVSVYSYPSLELVKTIKDTRTGPIGYYGSSQALITAENGDIYTFSTNSVSAGFTRPGTPSGILRIKNGETEFDESYHFDVETETGYKLLTGAYAGNGKIVARVLAVEEEWTAEWAWAAFTVTNPVCKMVVIDVINKTVTDISEDQLPLHGGQYSTPFYVNNGKVYVSVNDGTEAYIYAVDAATATAERGAKIVGSEVQAIYRIQ